MSTNDATRFIRDYGPESRNRIGFAWNGKHAEGFVDENDSFRQRIIAAVLAEPDAAGLDLVGDLFEAEARWSKEAWCVRDAFSALGSILLTRGGTAQLDRFLEWFAVSFDSYSECHAMSLNPVAPTPLIAEVERRLAGAVDEREKAGLEMARALFAKHKSGNPLAGMVKLGASELANAKASVESRGWFDWITRLFGGQ
jgi:hypothetical protein